MATPITSCSRVTIATRLPLLLLLTLLPVAVLGQSLAGRRQAASLLANSSVAGVLAGLRDRLFTCEDVVTEQLRRIDAYNASLKAFIAVNRETALALARSKDRQGGGQGPLHCVPVAVKDNIDVTGLPTTSGSLALQNMTAVQNSAVAARIIDMGGIIIGKTNMAEMSDSGVASASTLGGVCANPWDQRRSCLGSSGGSGAAVAAGLAVLGIGTDTEGSVIGPCAASGLLCIRPTQGPVFEQMTQGVYPAFQRQDLVGIMAKSRLDYLAAHDAVYGTDNAQLVANATRLDGKTIRFLDNFYESFPLPGGLTYTPDPELVRLHNRAAERFASLGATIDRYKVNQTELAGKLFAIFDATATKANCSNSCMKRSLDTYLSRYASTGPFRQASDLQTVAWGFPADYQAKLKFTLSQADADVCGAAACDPYNAARASITGILTELLGNASLLAVPFTAKLAQMNDETPNLADQISPALNPYSGWPSLSLPVGFSTSTGAEQPQGLPVSLVLMSTAGQELPLLEVASAYLGRYEEVRTPSGTPTLEVNGGGGAPGLAGGFGAAAAAAAAAAACVVAQLAAWRV